MSDDNNSKPSRVRLPKEGELLGIIEQMLGASRVRVRCADGKMRMGRIPGKMKKRIWMREGDYVVIKPWDIQGDEKGDIVWRYTRTEASWLRRNGKLKVLEGEEE